MAAIFRQYFIGKCYSMRICAISVGWTHFTDYWTGPDSGMLVGLFLVCLFVFSVWFRVVHLAGYPSISGCLYLIAR